MTVRSITIGGVSFDHETVKHMTLEEFYEQVKGKLQRVDYRKAYKMLDGGTAIKSKPVKKKK